MLRPCSYNMSYAFMVYLKTWSVIGILSSHHFFGGSEHLCQVQTIEHFRDEREGKAILDGDTVETPVVRTTPFSH